MARSDSERRLIEPAKVAADIRLGIPRASREVFGDDIADSTDYLRGVTLGAIGVVADAVVEQYDLPTRDTSIVYKHVMAGLIRALDHLEIDGEFDGDSES